MILMIIIDDGEVGDDNEDEDIDIVGDNIKDEDIEDEVIDSDYIRELKVEIINW